VDFKKEWEGRRDGGHRDQTESGLFKEAETRLPLLGEGRRLLDFGCGSADLLAYYARRFPECVGVDFSETMLGQAQRRLQEMGVGHVSLLRADHNGVWSRLVGKFDVITMAGVAQYLTREALIEFVDIAINRLNPGGRLVLFDVIDEGEQARRLCGIGRNDLPAWEIPLRMIGGPAWVAIQKARGRPLNGAGYGHPPSLFPGAQIVPTDIYDYRYHAIIVKGSEAPGRPDP
jgi:SAM-dependent methyltransferase